MKCKCGSTWVSVCPNCHEYTQTWQWISVEDRLPNNFQELLMTYNDIVTEGMYHSEIPNGGFYYSTNCYHDPITNCKCKELIQEGITHWMPLPIPPEVKD